MFTNQMILVLLLILLIVGGGGYFAFNKFKQEVSTATASPSPSPSGLSFMFETSQPSSSASSFVAAPQGPSKPAQPSPGERPLIKVKRLSAFPGILPFDTRKNKAVVIETAKGKIIIQIFPEVPQASSNFLLLASNGYKR